MGATRMGHSIFEVVWESSLTHRVMCVQGIHIEGIITMSGPCSVW